MKRVLVFGLLFTLVACEERVIEVALPASQSLNRDVKTSQLKTDNVSVYWDYESNIPVDSLR